MSLVPDQPGVYLVTVGVPSFGVDVTELPYRSFRGEVSKTKPNPDKPELKIDD